MATVRLTHLLICTGVTLGAGRRRLVRRRHETAGSGRIGDDHGTAGQLAVLEPAGVEHLSTRTASLEELFVARYGDGA